jgi:putative two-component system response regulator
MADLSQCNVLIVDDAEENVDILVEALADFYNVSVAMDGELALEYIYESKPDIILLDIMMPGLNGYEVCKKLKEDKSTSEIPIIFLTALTDEQDEEKGLLAGAVDYVTKPFSIHLLRARVRNQLELKMHRDYLEEMVQKRTAELELTQDIAIESLGTLAEYRDPETGGHIKRTQNYVKILACYLKDHPDYKEYLDDITVAFLYKSAPLHDIGKVGIPDSILFKKGKLTDDEFNEIKKHSAYGRDAIAISEKKLGKESFLQYARIMAESHHEKWDGTGYPHGLKGKDIPIPGRLMAIADVYDALISKRIYKPPFSHNKAVAIISEGKGKHFDPVMVDKFLKLEDQFRRIALEYADFEEERRNLTK